MFDKMTRLSKDGFHDAVRTFQASARAVNSTIAYLAVQAILHYYENARDISLCKHLHVALDEVGMGRQMTAFVHVLRATTPQTNIGTENWKGGKADAEPPEGYESVLAKLVTEEGEGVGSQLMLFAADPAKKKKSDNKGKAKQLKLPDGTPEALVNSVQRVLDSKTPAEVAQILTAAEKGAGAPEFKDPEAESMFRDVLVNLHKLEDNADNEVSFIYKDGDEDRMGKTNGLKALKRVLSQARGFSAKVLGDFADLQDDVKSAAIAANDEAA